MTRFPCNILFLIALIGFVVMGVLDAKLDSSGKKTGWIEQFVRTFQ